MKTRPEGRGTRNPASRLPSPPLNCSLKPDACARPGSQGAQGTPMSSWVRYSVAVYVGLLLAGAFVASKPAVARSVHAPAVAEPSEAPPELAHHTKPSAAPPATQPAGPAAT